MKYKDKETFIHFQNNCKNEGDSYIQKYSGKYEEKKYEEDGNITNSKKVSHTSKRQRNKISSNREKIAGEFRRFSAS